MISIISSALDDAQGALAHLAAPLPLEVSEGAEPVL